MALRDEKSFRLVAMAAKFLDLNKPCSDKYMHDCSRVACTPTLFYFSFRSFRNFGTMETWRHTSPISTIFRS